MLSDVLEVEVVPVLVGRLLRFLVNVGAVEGSGGGMGLEVIRGHINIDVPDRLNFVHLDGNSRDHCFSNGTILLVVELGFGLRLNHLLSELLFISLYICCSVVRSWHSLDPTSTLCPQ